MLKVNAEKLSKVVSLVANGNGKKGLNVLNTAITLMNEDGKLSLLTTTGVTTLKVTTDIDADDFVSCSVENVLFQQLLGKLSGEIELSIAEERFLLIKGSGEYKIPVVFDYSSNFALIPNIDRVDESGMKELDGEELDRAINICKNACPEDLNIPVLYNIYFGENVIATNDEKLIVVPNVTKFEGLLSVHNLSIVSSVFKGKTYYKKEGSTLVFQDEYSTLVTVMDNASEYPSQAAEGIELENSFEVEYDAIMSVIEKGKLFISPFDRNRIKVDINSDGIVLRSMSNDFYEEIAYSSPNEVESLSDLTVNLLDLASILTSCTSGAIKMSCTEDGPFVVSQNDYKGLVSLYE